MDDDCEDQGFTRIDEGCFRCLPTFDGGKPVRPKLVPVARHGRLWWTCPQCHGSYGDAARAALSDAPRSEP